MTVEKIQMISMYFPSISSEKIKRKIQETVKIKIKILLNKSKPNQI
jgi:hypothetical protein